MKKIMLVFGTRPEAIKMCPLVMELKKRQNFHVIVCVTGQHKEMLDSVLDIFHVSPDYNLGIMKEEQTLFDITVRVLENIQEILKKENPNIVLVHGDTTTAFAAALAAFYLNIPVGHIEAGLRTYNMMSPYPEEFNRHTIGLIAKYHFAPTERAKQNLLSEKKNADHVFVTGNTVIDAMKYTLHADYSDELLEWAKGKRIVLLTAHRRENLGEPMKNIFGALKRILSENGDVCIVYPVHRNPVVRQICEEFFASDERVKLIEPVDVERFHNMMAMSYLIVTDSGGIQEEAPALGKPVIVCRNTTERPEGVEAGTLLLAGNQADGIYNALNLLLHDATVYEKMAQSRNPYGDGTASIRIAEILERNTEW